jgi:hypothetical protein
LKSASGSAEKKTALSSPSTAENRDGAESASIALYA